MIGLYLYKTDEERFIQLIQKNSNTIKDAFVHIGVNISELYNQRRDTIDRDMILILIWIDTIKWRGNIIISPCHPYPSSS